MKGGDITSRLADFIENTKISRVPSSVVQGAKLLVTDFLGVGAAGSAEEPAKILRSLIRGELAGGACTVIGSDLQCHPTWASLANGISGHLLDYDDVSQPMYGHPTVAVLPACLALGEYLGAKGVTVLESYIVGLEVAVKLAYGMNPAHYEQGWHATCTLGTMGAAAGAARLLQLKGERLRSALALAASQAGGLQQNFGTMTKPFHPGRAAENGVLAGVLAQHGWTGDQNILDGARGFFQMFCGDGNYEAERSVARLGRPFDIEEPGIILKKYPSCAFSHPVIDAALDVAQAPHYDPEAVDRVEGHIHPLADQILIHTHPRTGLEAKFSMEACIALALVDGQINRRSFADYKITSRPIKDMMNRVGREVKTGEKAGPAEFGPATVKVFLKNGELLQARVEKAKGNPENPLSPEEIQEKYRDCCSGIIPEESIEESVALVDDLERLENIGPLMACFRIP